MQIRDISSVSQVINYNELDTFHRKSPEYYLVINTVFYFSKTKNKIRSLQLKCLNGVKRMLFPLRYSDDLIVVVIMVVAIVVVTIFVVVVVMVVFLL